MSKSNEEPLYKLTEHGENLLSTNNLNSKIGGREVGLGCFAVIAVVFLTVFITGAVSAGIGWILTRFVITPFWDVEFNPAWLAASIVVALLIGIFGRVGATK